MNVKGEKRTDFTELSSGLCVHTVDTFIRTHTLLHTSLCLSYTHTNNNNKVEFKERKALQINPKCFPVDTNPCSVSTPGLFTLWSAFFIFSLSSLLVIRCCFVH